jgi:hypothetical protein
MPPTFGMDNNPNIARVKLKNGAAMVAGEATVFIDAPEEMRPSLAAAVVRASYLYPDYEIIGLSNGISAAGVSPEEAKDVKRQIKYLLYREHIRTGFADYRNKALDRVYGTSK